ncbi:hypothetical protein ILYODFUR_038987 [Ilyodon furcidens]|uniref:Uncharacterized protein n=1 Tax=Ilyodon furcidens TaxID=33524 RepID=A0ABV0TT47_9TELE
MQVIKIPKAINNFSLPVFKMAPEVSQLFRLFSCSRWKTHAFSLPPSLLIPASAFVCIFLRASLCISSKLVNYGFGQLDSQHNWSNFFFPMGRQGKGDPLVQAGRSSLETQWILGSSGRLCA